jgi:hypothetical protein
MNRRKRRTALQLLELTAMTETCAMLQLANHVEPGNFRQDMTQHNMALW